LLVEARVLRRQPLERAMLIAVPVTALAVACSASWSTSVQDVGRPVRALGLAVLAGLSVAYALIRPGRLDRTVAATAAAFVGVSLISAAWSVEPRHTLEKAAAFGLVLLIAAAFAIGADAAAARDLLWALLAGAVLVALAGLLVAAVSPHDSVQAATRSVGRRYRGIGVNPNTVAMLFAVGVPLAAALWLDARSRTKRLLAVGAFLLLAGSIVAAGSRGAAAAAVVGLLVLAVALGRGPVPRAVAVGAAVALAVTAILITAVSAPLSAAEAARARTLVGNTERYTPNDAEYILRMADEIGSGGSRSSRSVFDTSGRLQAWRGAVRQGVDRPLLGYGFGTEEAVFVDRYRAFEGGVPENSFIGLFLQLGFVGLALFLALLAALVAAALREGGRIAAVGLAVLATGIALAVVQSYVYAVGNVATLGIWMCAFLPAGRE
jgi:O-antigen ligase